MRWLSGYGSSLPSTLEADCRAWAAGHGLLVRQVHVDRGRSGYQNVTRKGFEAARKAVTSGGVRTLIVWKLDRLSRKGTAEVGPLLDAFDLTGGRLVSVMDGLDSSRPGDRLAMASLAEWARAEAEIQGERIRHAKRYLRSRGRWIGGQPAYGLRIDTDSGQLTPDPETAVYARLIADEALSGRPLVKIARLLNEHEIAAPRGGLWQVGSLSQLLRAPAFAGLLPETETVWGEKRDCRRYTGVVRPYLDPQTGQPVVAGEGIITLEEQQRIVAELGSRTRLRSDGLKRPARGPAHLLTGLLFCAVEGCGTRMSRNGTSYVCQGVRLGHTCPGARAMATSVEAAVAAALLSRHPEMVARWEEGDVPQKRALLSEVVERVWVARATGRGRRFEPEKRLRVVWADEGDTGERTDRCDWLEPCQSAHVSVLPNSWAKVAGSTQGARNSAWRSSAAGS
ncbi:recombinase family protein [Streptomyces coeruleorubidus]|uniref:recombinase family protein n=1 Tax=Streptomyces coeruleorubidus TaxID=116188 RepID=UPI0036666CCB